MIVLANQTVDFNTPPVPFITSDGEGRILSSGLMPTEADCEAQAGIGQYAFGGYANMEVQYIVGATGNTPEAFNRPASPVNVTYAMEPPRVGSLPTVTLLYTVANSIVSVSGPVNQANTANGDAEVGLRFDIAGDYTITVADWPSLDYNLTVTVVD